MLLSQFKCETAYVFLSIQNNYSQALNVAILDITSDWSIHQIYPDKGENFMTIDAGRKEVVAITGSAGEDTLKVFATVDQINFRWLELPSLDKQIVPRGFETPNNPLEILLEAIDREQPPKRKLSVAASPSREWTAKQITLKVIE